MERGGGLSFCTGAQTKGKTAGARLRLTVVTLLQPTRADKEL